jgi:hypothetical protein
VLVRRRSATVCSTDAVEIDATLRAFYIIPEAWSPTARSTQSDINNMKVTNHGEVFRGLRTRPHELG